MKHQADETLKESLEILREQAIELTRDFNAGSCNMDLSAGHRESNRRLAIRYQRLWDTINYRLREDTCT